MRKQSISDRSRLNSVAQQILGNSTNTRENRSSSSQKRIQDFKIQIEELLLELQQKDLTIAALERNYEGLSKAYKIQHTSFTGCEASIKDLTDENQKLEEKVQELQESLEETKNSNQQAYDEYRELLQFYEEAKVYKAENITLNTLIEKRKRDVEEKTRKTEIMSDEITSLKEEIKLLEKELKKSKANLEKVWGANAEKMNEIDILKETVKTLTEELEDKKAILQTSERQTDILIANEALNSKKLVLLSQELSKVKDELSQARNKLEGLYDSYSELEHQTRTKTQMLKASDYITDELHNKISYMENGIESFKEYIADITNQNCLLSESLESEKEKSEQLETEVKEAQLISESVIKQSEHLKITVEALESSVSQLETSNDTLKTELESLSMELEKYKEIVETETGEINRVKIERLVNASIEINRLEHEIKSLLSQLTEIQQENNRLHLFSIEKEALRDKNESLNLQIEDLEKQLTLSYEQKAKELEKVRREKLDLQKSLEAMSEDEVANILLHQQVSHLSEQLKKTEKSHQEASNELTETTTSLSDLQKRVDLLEADKSALFHEKEFLRQRTTEQTKEIISLRNLQHRNSVLATENERCKEISEKLISENKKLVSDLERLNSQIDDSKRTISESNCENNELVWKIECMKEELEEYRPSEHRINKELQAIEEKESLACSSLKKIETSLEALDSSLQCESCHSGYLSSMILPCSHLACLSCEPPVEGDCPVCGTETKETVIISVVKEVVGKLSFNSQMLTELQNLLYS